MTPVATNFTSTPLLLSQSLLQFWLFPLRLMQVMLSVSAGAVNNIQSDAMRAADDIENRTTDALEVAEAQIAGIDAVADDSCDHMIAVSH